jgi:HAD superfamily hydrolase (TIGR01549 family)
LTVRCVLFDLFGTLVHYDARRVSQSYPDTFQFVQSLAGQAYPLNYESFLADTDRIFGELDAWAETHQREFSMQDFAKRLLEEQGIEADSGTLDQFSDLYTTEWSAGVVAVNGVHTFLSSCAKKFTTGVITNTHYEPMVMNLLARKSLKPFEIVTTSVSHGRPKPHADIFLDTLATLDIAPEEAVYVGDTYRADYEGATNAGLACYLIGQHARVPREFQIPTVLDLPMHLLR